MDILRELLMKWRIDGTNPKYQAQNRDMCVAWRTCADELEEALAALPGLSQPMTESAIARALANADKARDFRSVPYQGKMIGGSDVCATCEAHCIVMIEDEDAQQPMLTDEEIQEEEIVKVVREADALFEKGGGGTRWWTRGFIECLASARLKFARARMKGDA